MLLWYRMRISFRIVDNRDQGSPVSLAADRPIAEAVGGHTLSPSHTLEMVHDFFFGLHDFHPVKEVRIDHGSGFFLHLINVSNLVGISIGTNNNAEDGNIEG